MGIQLIALRILIVVMVLATGAGSSDAQGAVPEQEVPSWAAERFASGQAVEVIVQLDDDEIEAEVADFRGRRGGKPDDDALLNLKAERFARDKSRVMADVDRQATTLIAEYSHLPMLFIRLQSAQAFRMLSGHSLVRAVFLNEKIYPHLVQSLPLIGQPLPVTLGYDGSGTAIAVIDTGIDYRKATFGSCTAPGVPDACRVPAAVEIATADGQLDDIGHGTHVAGIAATVAPGSRLISLDVFNTDGSSTEALVIQAINWAIANRSQYGIGAINMSLGNGTKYTAACSSKTTNPFVTPIASARAAGIVPVASAGNEAYIDGISRPACTPGVVSVGAVYDANVGGRAWTVCTDNTTAGDKVACFSNSAGFLTMLAPGAIITSEAIAMGGTSQAAPHVAGAVAVLRTAFPADTPDQLIARLVDNGTPVTDSRNGLVLPRLNLPGALGAPANDLWQDRVNLSAADGSLQATNVNAGKETGEVDHAGNAGGKSVWWKLTPTVSGLVSLNTHGSDFDTLLAVYEETGGSGLTLVAANDNDGTSGGSGSLVFTGEAGKVYSVVIDGYNGASGLLDLAWSWQASSDLAIMITGTPDPVTVGAEVSYDVTVTNNGPSPATGITIRSSIRDGDAVLSMASGCSLADGMLTCTLAGLGAGDVAAFRFTISRAAAGSIEQSMSITSGVADPYQDNNSAATVTAVVGPSPAEPVPVLSPFGIIVAFLSIAIMLQRHASRRLL